MSSFPEHFGSWFTRFGEAEILLPVVAIVAIWIALSTRSLSNAMTWLLPMGVAALLTVLSKVVFIGWGVGIAAIDFTGVSGHTMFAAAIYPVLSGVVASWLSEPGTRISRGATVFGYAFAALVACSRVTTHAHSWSEVISAYVIGSTASAATLWTIRDFGRSPPLRWAVVGLIGWFVVMPLSAAPSRTQGLVTRLALSLSDHDKPYSRSDLHRAHGG